MPAGASGSPPRYLRSASRLTRSTSSSAAGTTPTPHQAIDRVHRGRDRGEGGAQRRPRRRQRHQAQRDLGDDRQRPFRADEELRQVVADDVLDRLAAGPDDGAVGEHGLEAEDVAARVAVLEGARPAGAFGDVAADAALAQAGRIRRIEQADGFDRVLQRPGDDAGLDDDQQVARIDRQDAREALERDDDAAPHGDGAAGVAGAGAARDERHAGLIAEPRDGRDFGGGAGDDDEIGGLAPLQRVGAVAEPRRVVDADEVGADDRGGGGDERRIHASRDGAGLGAHRRAYRPAATASYFFTKADSRSQASFSRSSELA